MKKNIGFVFAVNVLLAGFSVAIQAQQTEEKPEEVSTQKDENRQTSVPYESPQKKEGLDDEKVEIQERWSDFLPIWGKALREMGYELPLPFGVSASWITMDHGMQANNLSLVINGESYALNRIDINNMEADSNNMSLRFDVWLLPFLNLYALAGETTGEFSGTVDIPRIPGVIPDPVSVPFELDYDGTSVGAGTTIAGGYENFFGVLDINYTETDLDFVLDKAEALTTSVRLGWNGKIKKWNGGFWVGAMHQDIDQRWRFPIVQGGLEIIAEVDTEADQSVNYLLGARWNIIQEVEVMMEYGGFADRKQMLVSASYRF